MNMMHPDIEQADVLDRYVRRELSAEDEQAFEAHFFTCDDCFAKVQDTEQFRAGIRDAAAHGLLPDAESVTTTASGGWFRWGFALTSATTIILLGVVAWMYGRLGPRTHTPEANIPVAMLQASRAGTDPPTAVIPAGAEHLVLWIDVGPSPYRRFKLEMFTPDNQVMISLDRLEPNAYGAIAASIPAETFQVRDVRITLSGQDPPPAALVGEYQLRIDKR